MQIRKDKMMHNLKVKLSGSKKAVALLSTVLLLTIVVGGTVAYLVTSSESVMNRFTPSYVDCIVTEEFDGVVKKNVNVTNTGDTDVYVRVNLISYRVNEEGVRIGGKAEIPSLTLGEGWVQHEDGFYYYTSPVAPLGSPATNLIGEDGIELLSYTDVDGGYQVVEVMAEAIQASGTDVNGRTPTQLSWAVTISNGNVVAWSEK